MNFGIDVSSEKKDDNNNLRFLIPESNVGATWTYKLGNIHLTK